MGKITLSLVVQLLLSSLIFAQVRTVTGKITDDKGFAIGGVSVLEKGTKNGSSTNDDGTFSLKVRNGATLIISALSFEDKLVKAADIVNVQMIKTTENLDEVVVTALGIKREKRSLGYGTQTIGTEELNKSGTGNPLSELNGKASGLTVINSSGDPGAGTYIRLRGVTSITGNNQPLMVVDGVPIDNSINNYDATSATPNVSGASSNLTGGVQPTNRGVDINPNDVESITLLKGPAATALYGIQAASGALIITTKKGGSGKRGPSISFNSSFTMDKVNRTPPRQNIFAQGNKGVYAGPSGGSARKFTWGPAIDSLYWDGVPNTFDPHGKIVGASSSAKKIPVYAYNPYDFFVTGLTYNNSIALSGGNSKTGYRMSLGNVDQSGIIPRSKYDKTTFSLSGQSAITDKLSVSGGINYIRSANDKVQQGSNISSVMLGLLRTPTTFDNSNGLSNPVDNTASYIQPSGVQRDYRGGAGYDNPYWTVNKNPFHEELNRVFGYGQATYVLADWISLNYRLGGDSYSQNGKNVYDKQSNAFPAGAIHLLNYNVSQYNSDFTINMKKTFSQAFSGTLLLGHNYFTTKSTSRLAHGSGFILPGFLDMSNATSYTSSESESKKRTMAFYGEATMTFNDMLFLTVTGREETSSTLPAKNNHFFYPSASLAYEFTKMEGLSGKTLTYGKIRASFAQVGKDAPVQGLQTYYNQASIADGFTSGIQFPINANAGYQYSSTISVIGNPELKAEKTNSYELGADLGFFKNRISLNATAYYSKSSDVILTVPIAYTTGFASELLNAATITNKGLEITLNTTPVKTNDFRWDLNFNWSRNINKVVSLATGVPKVLIAGFQNGEIDAIAGEPFGSIYGSVYVRSDPNNKNSPLLIDDNTADLGYGMPIVSSQNASVGNVNPDWNGSVITNFTYKGFTVGAQLDIRHGGSIWNGTRGAMSYFGTSQETSNRGQANTFKGLLGHLNTSGSIVHNESGVEVAKPGAVNTIASSFSQYYWQSVGSSFIGPAEPSVEDGSFARIRQISIGYEIPKKILTGSPFVSASLTFFANNPVLWTSYKGVDPETSLAGPANGQGLDYFNNPGTKSYGVRLSIGL